MRKILQLFRKKKEQPKGAVWEFEIPELKPGESVSIPLGVFRSEPKDLKPGQHVIHGFEGYTVVSSKKEKSNDQD